MAKNNSLDEEFQLYKGFTINKNYPGTATCSLELLPDLGSEPEEDWLPNWHKNTDHSDKPGHKQLARISALIVLH